MKFAELLSKVTVSTQNQVPSQEKAKKGYNIITKAMGERDFQELREQKIQCYVNGKKRNKKVKKEVEVTE